jgi:hypothetical protein
MKGWIFLLYFYGMTFNPNKPPKKVNGNEIIGTIDLNSAEMRKETPQQRAERARLEKESGVKANVYKDRTKYERNTKHKGNKLD